ncbi:hypothetical protein PVAND_013736 [Polypedilum vanderplanki]|uniref:Amino acid transporter transmembrane domain-containing protein n=1 Tax=Polypedilum vanderplanki TaxID=319348 RepID=A0A9J6CSH0_POLVA|nr:hypothetical protein PVAND_013736 [Polypedilum vanderplanki]
MEYDKNIENKILTENLLPKGEQNNNIDMELNGSSNVIVNENYRRSADKDFDQLHPAVVKLKAAAENGSSVKNRNTEPNNNERPHPKTTYLETLMHLFKGNVGPGCLAMADAVKNGGLILAPILTLFLGIVCVHVQHILLQCSKEMQIKYDLAESPDYAETVELVFASSDNQKCTKYAKTMKAICNAFICITQLGFCCIYFLFIGTNLKQVLDFYGLRIPFGLLVAIILIPIWLSSLIRNLKYLAPCSGIANVCMITGLVISYYYSLQDLPPITERNFMPHDIRTLPLFFGTVIFAFEGIALVLPLQNAMKKPQNFSKCFGVLNVGMVIVSGIFVSFGTIGYLKYGEDTKASLTLNLPTDEILAQSVKLAIALGVLLGYAIQFFVAMQIMFPNIRQNFKFSDRNPIISELIFRTLMVLITFTIAVLIPELDLLLSLIGSVCSTVLALVLPPLMELIITSSCENNNRSKFVIIKNFIILLISLLGFLTGGFEALSAILQKMFSNEIFETT